MRCPRVGIVPKQQGPSAEVRALPSLGGREVAYGVVSGHTIHELTRSKVGVVVAENGPFLCLPFVL